MSTGVHCLASGGCLLSRSQYCGVWGSRLERESRHLSGIYLIFANEFMNERMNNFHFSISRLSPMTVYLMLGGSTLYFLFLFLPSLGSPWLGHLSHGAPAAWAGGGVLPLSLPFVRCHGCFPWLGTPAWQYTLCIPVTCCVFHLWLISGGLWILFGQKSFWHLARLGGFQSVPFIFRMCLCCWFVRQACDLPLSPFIPLWCVDTVAKIRGPTTWLSYKKLFFCLFKIFKRKILLVIEMW